MIENNVAHRRATRPGLSRRGFPRLTAAGAIGPAIVEMARPASTSAREAAEPSPTTAFAEVATRRRVPPEANEYERRDPHGWDGYGTMQLVQSPQAGTLGAASRLTGIPREALETDRESNILGGAALLARSQGMRPVRLGDYYGAVAGSGSDGEPFEAVAGIEAGETYTGQVFAVLERGARKTTRDGERVSLTAWDTASAINKPER